MPATDFVNLKRRFRDLRDSELAQDGLEEPEDFVSLGELGLGRPFGWSELLDHHRVVVLAEAGAGKSREMEEQAKRLVAEDRYAFFVPLESLDKEPLTNLLEPAQERALEAWKGDMREPAWFFLDAVDELKLTNGKLDRALLRLSREIDGHRGRAHVLVSCRPSDWRPSLDLKTIHNRLAVPEVAGEIVEKEPEEVFMAALQREAPEPARFELFAPTEPATTDIWTVAMVPLDDGQIRQFAEHHDLQDTQAFVEEIERENAWGFARRPLDLADLVASWRDSGRLGTPADQHEANAATKLREDPDRPDKGVLSDRDARLGAETLALGLALTRTRTIGSPEQTADGIPAAGSLHAESVLPEWTEAQRQALLRRALFDPATYGRIRFHHRTVQEYLAACRLRRLRDRGMTGKALFRLLFAKVHGVDVVRPSTRAISAWLALWDFDVRKELMRREPEVLLSFGDPSALELEARAGLVRAFVSAYRNGGWRGLDVSSEAVRRLSHPELADVVRVCWEEGSANVEVRELLLEMILHGPIERCADFACDAALDNACENRCRIVAVKALLACNLEDTVRECAIAMLANDASWPDEVVLCLAKDLFPRIVSAEELTALVEARHEELGTSSEFGWIAMEIANTVDPSSKPAMELRRGMADLMLGAGEHKRETHQVRSKFGYLAPALAALCERQLSDLAGGLNPELIEACAIASRFGADETDSVDSIAKLRRRFEAGASMRSQAFWAEWTLLERLVPTNYEWRYFHRIGPALLVGALTDADRPWLEAAIADRSCPERRSMALHVLVDLGFGRGRVSSELEGLRELVKDDAHLVRALMKEATPPPRDDESQKRIEESERRIKQLDRDRAAGEQKRIRDWRKWRKWLVDNLEEAFSPAKVDGTLSTIQLWLRGYKRDSGRFNSWNEEALVKAFGTGVAERTESALRDFWRRTEPGLWSARPAEARNSTPQDWIMGLVGVSAEASHSGWAGELTPEEARKATAYATVEMNGFAPFIVDLVKAHPSAVEEVIGGEVVAELALGDQCEHLPTLQNLGHADHQLKRLLVPRLREELASWPSEVTAEAVPKRRHYLERVLGVLTAADDEAVRKVISRVCLERFQTDSRGPLATMWLRGLFLFDAKSGTRALVGALGDGRDPNASARAVGTFASLFGGYDPVVPEISNPVERAQVLGELVRSAYAFVRVEDDLVHKGLYGSDTRGDAQMARNFLLSKLLDTPGPEACRVVLQLASEKDFEHFPDRLRLLARMKAAAEGELEPFGPADLIALLDNLEAPERTSAGLFSVMMDRLGALAHDLRHHEFSDRRTVQGITEESEMRRTLAMRLHAEANGVYKVTQEEEVADRKRTDIRLLAAGGSHKAVIEIKIADKRWTLKQLVQAIEEQLVGRYLRHTDCKAGCLLLTYSGRRKYWQHPESRNRLTSLEAVEFLRGEASRIETETLSDVRLGVFLLDLTDPN